MLHRELLSLLSQSAAPQCLSVHRVTWVLWAVSPSISSRGGLSGWISEPREANADMLRQLHSDWEGVYWTERNLHLCHTNTQRKTPVHKHAREHTAEAASVHNSVCDVTPRKNESKHRAQLCCWLYSLGGCYESSPPC